MSNSYRSLSEWQAVVSELAGFGRARAVATTADAAALARLKATGIIPTTDAIFGRPAPEPIARGDAKAFLDNLEGIASGTVKAV